MLKSGDTYLRIWRTVTKIPRGRVSSYGTVARLSGFPGAPRLAGYALHNLPPGSDIPWHRVLNARGMISLPGRRGAEQERLLMSEGVAVRDRCVDLAMFAWPGRRNTSRRRTGGRYGSS
ncbi:MAG TPA: MGMT family protein [Bacteroidota bacterium]|nr:MGMT family protein [Bacteroidota bacterium]